MNKLIGLASVVVITAVCLAGCTPQPAPPATPSAGVTPREYTVDGYPLDRSAAQVAAWKNLHVAVELKDLTIGDSVWLTPDGRAPDYLREGRVPTEEEGAQMPTIATPVTGRVSESLWGDARVGSSITVFFSGGTADGVTVRTSAELAPNMADISAAGSIVVAGAVVTTAQGVGVDPIFVYSSIDGTLASLVDSTGTERRPSFAKAGLQQLLHKRACKATPTHTKLEDRGQLTPICNS